MFESDNDSGGAAVEPAQETRFQWLVPFLGGLVAALFIAAVVFAAYILKMGPFSVSARQAEIESAVTDATDEVQRQIDEAAFNEDAAIDPALAASQAISIGALQFGPASVQTIAELGSAEARGLAKCEPALSALDPNERAVLKQVSCTLTPQSSGAAAGQPAPPPSTIAFNFANGRVTSLNYTLGGVQPPAPAGDALPTAPAELQTPPQPETPPSAPAASDAPPAAGDAPPAE